LSFQYRNKNKRKAKNCYQNIKSHEISGFCFG
jgi:hypothetical protein